MVIWDVFLGFRIKGRRLCWDQEVRFAIKKEKTIKNKELKRNILKEETEYYWNLFKQGNFNSLREFAKKEYPKSHVSLTKNFKKFISEFNPIERYSYK